MHTITAPAPSDITTTAQRVMPGDILLDVTGRPVVLVTRARTRMTGRRVTQIEGEWLVERPTTAPRIFRRSTLSTAVTYVRRGAA